MTLWSNPNDVILDPFAGIGSTGFVTVKAGRRFIGAELKESYYRQAAGNLARAENEKEVVGLFAESEEAA